MLVSIYILKCSANVLPKWLYNFVHRMRLIFSIASTLN